MTITQIPDKRRAHVLPSCMLAAILLLPACGVPASKGIAETVVPATDYAFALPATMPPGPATFRLDNRGKVPHEMAMGRLRAGVTADSVMAFASKGGDPGELADGIVGILISEPGQQSIGTLNSDLVAGRTYMLICQFKDADSLPPHMAMGMMASFVVN